jgi:hypothetical protein
VVNVAAGAEDRAADLGREPTVPLPPGHRLDADLSLEGGEVLLSPVLNGLT